MELITRRQFRNKFKKYPPEVLWIPETNFGNKSIKFIWFVGTQYIVTQNKEDYFWNWCNDNLNGKVSCFSSNSIMNIDWWGFTDKDDIVPWVLKWA